MSIIIDILTGTMKLRDAWPKINSNFAGIKTEVDAIVTGSANAEVGQAHVSTVKSKTFTTLDDRLEEDEQDLVTYKAETATVINVGKYPTIQDAIDKAVSIKTTNLKPILYFPYGEGFLSLVPIYIPSGIHVIMKSKLIYTGIANTVFLTIGETNVANMGVRLNLNVYRETISDWSSENDVGVVLYNCISSPRIDLTAYRFTIGVQCLGSSAGFSYNHVFINDLCSCKILLDLSNESGGWCNENDFYGGRFWNKTGVNLTADRNAVRITSKDGSYLSNSNNIFYKPSFELHQSDTTGEAIPILIVHGIVNAFHDCRDEDNSSTYFARIQNASADNVFDIGYGGQSADGQKRKIDGDGYLTSRSRLRYLELGKLIHSTGFLPKKACYYNGAANVNIQGVHIVNSGNSNRETNATGYTINADNILFGSTRGLGIMVNTTVAKSFVVKKDVVEALYGGRVGVRCYDVNGTIIDGSIVPCIKKSNLAWSTLFGGHYTTGLDGISSGFFTVTDDVKSIDVFIKGGTSDCKLKGFAVYTADGQYATCYPYNPDFAPGFNIATTPPTAGVWPVGKKIVQAVAVVGQPKGWVNTSIIEPGTWVSEGNL